MSEPTILAVILNYRTPELAVEATAATLAAMQGLGGEIAIVDNDSQDGSLEHITRAVAENGWDATGRVHVHASGRNGGFGAGNNFAIRAGLSTGARPDYVYLVNPDAQPEPDAIRVLVDFLEAHPKAGVAGSLILQPDGTPAYGAFKFPSLIGEFEDAAQTAVLSRLLRNGEVSNMTPEEATRVDWVSGSSVMFRQAMLDEVGIFDETFFLYFEETDLCLRGHRAGWEVWYLPQSRVVHIGGMATGICSWERQPGYWFDSRLHYLVKNHGRGHAVAATLSLLAGEAAWGLRRLVRPKAERYRVARRFGLDLMQHSLRAMLPRRAAVADPPPGTPVEDRH